MITHMSALTSFGAHMSAHPSLGAHMSAHTSLGAHMIACMCVFLPRAHMYVFERISFS